MHSVSTRKIRVILAATDLSPAADLAVEQAALLARKWNAELCLLHVFNDSIWNSIKAIYTAENWSDTDPVLLARNRLSKQVKTLSEQHGIRVHGETRTGEAVPMIADFVREQQAQLLVVGEHGEDWIGDTLLGGTAVNLIEQAKIPVLLVRRVVPEDFSTILTATDFSDNAQRAARWSSECFPSARHILLHAYFVAFEGRLRMAGASSDDIERFRDDELARTEIQIIRQVAELAPHQPQRLLMRGYPAAALLEQSERLGADVIVMGVHGNAALGKRLLGSVTQNVLYHARCNVLLVP